MPPPAGSSSRSWLAGVLPFCARSWARNCAGAAHLAHLQSRKTARAIMPNLLSPLTARPLPIHPFLKSVPQSGTPILFTFHYSLFTKPAPCGEQFALIACGSAFLLHTQPSPEVCRGCTPSHTCNPRSPPGNHAKPPLPLTASPPPTPPLSKIRCRNAAHQPSSLFTIPYSLFTKKAPAGRNAS